jgi:hypothetical protein
MQENTSTKQQRQGLTTKAGEFLIGNDLSSCDAAGVRQCESPAREFGVSPHRGRVEAIRIFLVTKKQTGLL